MAKDNTAHITWELLNMHSLSSYPAEGGAQPCEFESPSRWFWHMLKKHEPPLLFSFLLWRQDPEFGGSEAMFPGKWYISQPTLWYEGRSMNMHVEATGRSN